MCLTTNLTATTRSPGAAFHLPELDGPQNPPAPCACYEHIAHCLSTSLKRTAQAHHHLSMSGKTSVFSSLSFATLTLSISYTSKPCIAPISRPRQPAAADTAAT